MSASARVLASLKASIGDVVFGMEDGTVSIFGLVFGVAISTNDPRTVLIAGATGAAAAAVSMMAGSYLDAESVRDARRARRDGPVDPAVARTEADAITAALTRGGMAPQDVTRVADALARAPRAVAGLRTELAEADDGASPTSHAFWMFVSDLFAGFTPVLPFAFLPMDSARMVSLGLTTVLLVVLGVGRGLVAKRSVVRATLETLGIAASAALAGIAMGHFLS
ncbi:VIT1/CCC1 transporter family protein [Xanthobacter dioxanivorans]|uniref:VIT1/CCC1 transporter family protein n=1 Tax=Xanthobacter dioxanivorans TaxID=2528964 RepID=A0A974SFV6_9HYPH|nr:VIT1/CCC1 transporter family protein [Xanthobacter dioxanivorans]QRG04676.1 VIT1/CCC1 transporter family protein [Xanthobacter dioxanivorans]